MAQTLTEYTEQAIRVMYTGELIPPIVYIPHAMKRGKHRLRLNGAVTINAKSRAEIEEQLALADPQGFLIALMNGQPIPGFEITKTDRSYSIETVYHVAPLELRTQVAIELARKQRGMTKKVDPDFMARIKEAAEAYDAEKNA